MLSDSRDTDLVSPASIFGGHELKELLKILERTGPQRPTRTSEYICVIWSVLTSGSFILEMKAQ